MQLPCICDAFTSRLRCKIYFHLMKKFQVIIFYKIRICYWQHVWEKVIKYLHNKTKTTIFAR